MHPYSPMFLWQFLVRVKKKPLKVKNAFYISCCKITHFHYNSLSTSALKKALLYYLGKA